MSNLLINSMSAEIFKEDYHTAIIDRIHIDHRMYCEANGGPVSTISCRHSIWGPTSVSYALYGRSWTPYSKSGGWVGG